MSFIPVLAYGLGIGVFGFAYWLLDGILDTFIALGIHETGTAYDFMLYAWTASLVVYLIFGGFWLIRKYNEEQYVKGLL